MPTATLDDLIAKVESLDGTATELIETVRAVKTSMQGTGAGVTLGAITSALSAVVNDSRDAAALSAEEAGTFADEAASSNHAAGLSADAASASQIAAALSAEAAASSATDAFDFAVLSDDSAKSAAADKLGTEADKIQTGLDSEATAVSRIIATQQAALSGASAEASQLSRLASEAASGVALNAKTAAEAARDAAQLSAGVYPTTAVGLAATEATRYFSVPSADNNEYLILYRHDQAGAVHSAVEIQRYPSVAGIEYTVANTLYVKANGNNARNGGSWKNALLTIERALELATLAGVPTLIEWAPQSPVYTNGHLDMPDGCVIKAAHRTVFLRPNAGFEERNVFRMGSGCFIEGIMFEGWRIDDLDNPSEGFAVSFRPNAVITRVPYAHKIAVRSIPTWGMVAPPLDRANSNPLVPRGGGVVLADGMVCSQYSIFPNIMTWGATPVTPNGIGYCAKNGALINAVNAVSMWAHKHFMALSGGQVILSSCSTQFGDYSLHASGSRSVITPAASSVALRAFSLESALVQASSATIVNNMWTALVDGGYTAGWTTLRGEQSRSDATLLLRCLSWTLTSGNEQPMLDFAKGLFNTIGQPVFAASTLPAFLFGFTKLRDAVNALPGMSAASKTLVSALFAALSSTVSSPADFIRKDPSRITAIGHTWTAVMAGVALTKLPPALNRATIQDSIIEADDGVVIASGQDDQGNALFVGGLQINADTGELGGPPFDQAVRRLAIRAAISRSF
jgi:hypothetical protein